MSMLIKLQSKGGMNEPLRGPEFPGHQRIRISKAQGFKFKEDGFEDMKAETDSSLMTRGTNCGPLDLHS